MKNKFNINGRVDCKCGDQILSNSGKAMFPAETNGAISGLMRCWNRECDRIYPCDDIYSARVENKVVIFDDSTDIKIFKVGDCDWVAAKSCDEALEWYNEEFGDDIKIPDEVSIYGLIGDMENEKKKITFRMAVDREKDFPCIIASTEF